MTLKLLKHHWSTLLTCFWDRTTTIFHFFLLFFVVATPLSEIRSSFPLLKQKTHTNLVHCLTPHYCRNNSVQQLFRLSFSRCWNTICQQPFIIFFPDAETPLFNTFSSHSQNTTVHHYLTSHHCRNNSVQQLFRLFFFHCWNTIVSNPSSFFHDAKTPLFGTFDCSSLTMLKHSWSARLTFFMMLKHHCSACSTSSWCWHTTVQHFLTFFRYRNTSHQQFFIYSLVLFFSVAETPVFHHRPIASFYDLRLIVHPSKQQTPDAIKSRRHNNITTNKHDI